MLERRMVKETESEMKRGKKGVREEERDGRQ